MTFVKHIARQAVQEIATAFPAQESAVFRHPHRPDQGYSIKAGAGIIPYSLDLGQYCLYQRAKHTSEPVTWGPAGGAIEEGETPEQAALREFKEETGYDGPIELVEIYVYRDLDFTFTTFAGIVPKEFKPTLAEHELIGYRWDNFGRWPDPLHFGFKALLDDPEANARLMAVDSNANN